MIKADTTELDMKKLTERLKKLNEKESNNTCDLDAVIIRCPLCKSENIKDNSTTANNGVFGSGYSSWKVTDSRNCEDCGMIFKPVQGNGL